jgi:hypothetical protein
MKMKQQSLARLYALSALLTFCHGLPCLADIVDAPAPSQYNYNSATVKQLKVRNEYGRYITFAGKTNNSWRGTAGYCNPTYGCYPGSASGSENRDFVYQLDCRDLTFDRKGDKARGIRKKGWASVNTDPVAEAVAREYCPQIETLPLAASD